MTAEFNITIPGAEIIKRLTDLETQVRDLANERAVDKVLVNAHTDNIAGLIDRVDRLTDFVNGKTIHTPEWPNVKPVQTTVAPPYASTSHVERIAEDLTDLKVRIERENQNIWSYIQHVKTDLSERFTAADRARTDGYDSIHGLITSTANAIWGVVNKLEQRISDCELAVGTDKLDGAPTPNHPTNDPEPPVDTSWHPYDVLVDGVVGDHPTGDKRVVVMQRDGTVVGPGTANGFFWVEYGPDTVVAWRYAKAGE